MTQMEQDEFTPPAEESIRLLLPSEYRDYAAHLLRLDPLSRFMRFAGLVSDSALRRHAARVADQRAVVLGYFAEGELRGVAELHPLPVRPDRPRAAEIAFSVERPFQGRGIGSRLMDRVIAYAQAHGFEDLQMMFLATNGQMKRMAIQHDAQLTNDEDEVIASLRPRGATPFSWARHAARGLAAAANAAATMPRRLFSARPSQN